MSLKRAWPTTVCLLGVLSGWGCGSGVPSSPVSSPLQPSAPRTVAASNPDGGPSPAPVATPSATDAGPTSSVPDAGVGGPVSRTEDWTRVGASFGAANQGLEEIAFTRAGLPVVASLDYDGVTPSSRVYVRAWDGSAWNLLGGPLQANTDFPYAHAVWVALAVDARDRPIVAFDEGDANSGLAFHLHVFRWESGVWSPLGGPLSQTTGLTFPGGVQLAMGQDGNPFVAWSEGTDNSGMMIAVQHWSGSSWVEAAPSLGGVARGGDAVSPSLRVDTSGNLVLAYQQRGGISVARASGSGWTPLGAPLIQSAGDFTYSPALALDSAGNIFVAFSEFDAPFGSRSPHTRGVLMFRWSGQSWAQLGDARRGTVDSRDAVKLVVDSHQHPALLWTESLASPYTVHVSRWDGSEFSELGAGLEGLSGGALAADASGSLYLAAELGSDSSARPVSVQRMSL